MSDNRKENDNLRKKEKNQCHRKERDNLKKRLKNYPDSSTTKKRAEHVIIPPLKNGRNLRNWRKKGRYPLLKKKPLTTSEKGRKKSFPLSAVPISPRKLGSTLTKTIYTISKKKEFSRSKKTVTISEKPAKS